MVMVVAAVVVLERPPVVFAPRVVAVHRLCCREARAGDLTDDEKRLWDWPGDEK